MTMPPDDAPDTRLASLLDALPREATPPAGVWSRVLAAERARRGRRRLGIGAAAAALAVVAAWGAWPARPLTRATSPFSATVSGDMTPGIFSRAVLPEEARDPRLRAAVQEFEAWQVALTDPRRSFGWPNAARRAVVDAVRDTEAELAAVRAALVVHAGDEARRQILLDHLTTLRALQLEQLQRARVLLDQL